MKLQKRSEIKKEVEKVKTVEEADQFAKQYADIRAALKLTNKERDQINDATEAYLWHCRNGGEILIHMAKEGTRYGGMGGNRKIKSHCGTRSLAELRITKNKSSRWQALARVPEKVFCSKMAEEREKDEPFGVSGLFKEALEANRVASKKKRKEEREDSAEKVEAERCQLILGDLIEAGSEIADESINAIITDPPYEEKYADLYFKLKELAERVLVPGGNLLVMVGQAYPLMTFNAFNDAFNRKGRLIYNWTLAYMLPGAANRIHGRKILNNWKPVYWFVKDRLDWEYTQDVLISEAPDKEHHDWGQSISGITELVKRFTVKNQIILDPFLGGGSTAAAALKLERRFIGIDIDPKCIEVTKKRLS